MRQISASVLKIDTLIPPHHYFLIVLNPTIFANR